MESVPAGADGRDAIANTKACANCARIKCKCIRRVGGSSGCERCHRLKKECVPSPSAVKRPRARRYASRSARLEEKLDDLVLLLRTQRSTSENHTHDDAQVDEDLSDSETDGYATSGAILTPALTNDQNHGNSTAPSSSATSLVVLSSVPGEPSPREAEEALAIFRQDTIAFFPFTYIPPQVTSQQLREAYPFLWLAIISITSRSPEARASLGSHARTVLIQKVIIDRERSLDLLLGALCLAGWIHLLPINKPYLSIITQLIVTSVGDLSLHKPPLPPNASSFCGVAMPEPKRTSRTDQERRALLAAFVVTSMTNYVCKRPGGLRWGPYFDEQVAHLSENSPVLQDKILISQVKLQLIVDQLHYSPWPSNGREVPAAYLSALRSQVQEVMGRGMVDEVVGSHPMMLLFRHFTDFRISESVMGKQSPPLNEPDWRRYDTYHSCLMSIEAWIDTFLSAPYALHASMPYVAYAQMVHIVTCLHHLTVLQDPAWDRTAVRQVIDLIPTLDKINATLNHLKAEKDGGNSWVASIFAQMKAQWQAELASMQPAIYPAPEGNIAETLTMPLHAEDMVWLSDMLDSPWL